jgi:hypothetical protein
MWMNLCGMLIALCIFPLIAMIAIELRTRPARPEYVSRPAAVGQLAMWPLMAVITFFFASLPALHAQWKLASGRGLVYRVAEKGTRRVPVAVPAAEHVAEPVAAVGGGS